ncbi:hypothetical protein EAO74_26420 [Streptomyces sp. gb1(2016)]|uniref:Uncharacterized protein n=1 Tax=Streptomyces sp. gb1(2016) TaxID=1828321 RepID=A0A652KK29_9ACTN|nr:hypothetical protein EAO74_26420 [Streptomyces sp. gb1(2016)]
MWTMYAQRAAPAVRKTSEGASHQRLSTICRTGTRASRVMTTPRTIASADATPIPVRVCSSRTPWGWRTRAPYAT